ncbi:MAG TPA: tryptophan 7-halogenase [Abditibacteriaceae bacterium]|jgi:flavin-dependent dehydrogenase
MLTAKASKSELISKTASLETEILIVGGGPAGATAALNLAPLRRVLLVEREAVSRLRIGESLVPAARRLLADMGLLESFLQEGHQPWFGKRMVWGNPELQEVDFLRDLDGPGWHLNRARFEQWLLDQAQEAGATLLRPATLDTLEHDGHRWRVRLQTASGSRLLTADVVLDAGGRAAPVARKLGLHARRSDRLICLWGYGRDTQDCGRGLTYVEAVAQGWWYTAPLPGCRRVLAFHTDADLPAARTLREEQSRLDGLSGGITATGELARLLADVGFAPEPERGVTAAHSAHLESPAGTLEKTEGFSGASAAWLAVGDAALSFDPLSSQGLLNALFTGLAAAQAVDSHLEGDDKALLNYSELIEGIGEAYRRHLSLAYEAEMRWPQAPFWQRRHL